MTFHTTGIHAKIAAHISYLKNSARATYSRLEHELTTVLDRHMCTIIMTKDVPYVFCFKHFSHGIAQVLTLPCILLSKMSLYINIVFDL